MRVLFLATYFPKPTNPTMGVWALKEAQQLQAAGADVRVVSFTSWVPRVLSRIGKASAWARCPARHIWDGLLVEYPRWPFYQVGRFKKLWYRRPSLSISLAWPFAKLFLDRFVTDWRPDVVFAHHGTVNGLVAIRLRHKFGIPFVAKDYDYYEIEDCLKFTGRRAAYQKIADQAAAWLAASNRMKDSIRSLFPDTSPIVHHNGADPIPDETLARPRPTELKGKCVISSGGIFYERKGIPLLVRAFAEISERHPDCVLRIFGDGQEKPLVEDEIRKRGLSNRVTLLGFQAHTQVLQELVWSDIFALVGWDEPFATVYLEAMSAGKPIICASDGGINDVVKSGVHGLVVPPRNVDAAAAALEKLVSDADFRKKCGVESTRLYQTQLSAQASATKLFGILKAAAD